MRNFPPIRGQEIISQTHWQKSTYCPQTAPAKICSHKIFDPENVGPKTCWLNNLGKNWWSKKNFCPKHFGSKNSVKRLLVQKMLCQKNFVSGKIWTIKKCSHPKMYLVNNSFGWNPGQMLQGHMLAWQMSLDGCAMQNIIS